MATLRDIKLKIKSIQSTQKITRAMKLVSTAKLKQAVDRVVAARPYVTKMREVVCQLCQSSGLTDHPFFQSPGVVKRVAVLVVSGDKGLCGAFNTDIFRRASRLLGEYQSAGIEVELFLFGKKGNEFFKRQKLTIRNFLSGFSNRPDIQKITSLSQELRDQFVAGYFQRVVIVSSQYISTLVNKPNTLQLLPITHEILEEQGKKSKIKNLEYLFEPDSKQILEDLLPRYFNTSLYQAILEAAAGEHASRMIAMGAATDRAGEMVGGLTLVYNRVRQSTITKQLIEIVSGAEALDQ